MTNEPPWLTLTSALADTGVFILWYRGDPRARIFFRNPAIEILKLLKEHEQLSISELARLTRASKNTIKVSFERVNSIGQIAKRARRGICLLRFPSIPLYR